MAARKTASMIVMERHIKLQQHLEELARISGMTVEDILMKDGFLMGQMYMLFLIEVDMM